MNTQEAIFLKEQFENQAKGLILKGKVVDIYYEAERILRGWDKIKRRGCTCEYRTMSNIVNSLFDQNKSTIDQLYSEYKEQLQDRPLSSGDSDLQRLQAGSVDGEAIQERPEQVLDSSTRSNRKVSKRKPAAKRGVQKG